MKKIKAFTIIELIISISIVSILSWIWFISFKWYIIDARNSERISNLSQLTTGLKVFKSSKWSLPFPENYFEITNSWTIVAYQWKLGKNIWLSTIDNIPYDPKLEIPYTYSITKNKQEYSIALTLEWEDNEEEIARTMWNYKSVSKNILPSILVATWTTVDINESENKKLFIFDKQGNNLAYSFENWIEPLSDWTDFSTLLDNAINSDSFSQNSYFTTCEEIEEAKKNIWDWDYELRTETWSLTSSWCTF